MNIKTLITSNIENERLFEILDSLLEQGVITLTDLESEFIESNPLKNNRPFDLDLITWSPVLKTSNTTISTHIPTH